MTEKFEVIVCTYNNPFALDLALAGLFFQNISDFSIQVADDGSGDETRKVVDKWRAIFGDDRLRHTWHPDEGFQKNKILNSAIFASEADYLVFIDGDCIAAPDFVQSHVKRRAENRFLSGSVIRLPQHFVGSVMEGSIGSGELFTLRWLRDHGGIYSVGSFLKASVIPTAISRLLEKITPVKIVWNGGNSSAWRKDLLAVNGFDESIQYGAEDVDLGVRLNNFGVRGAHIRYTALLIHLEHDRPYADPVQARKNKDLLKIKRRSGAYYAAKGVDARIDMD